MCSSLGLKVIGNKTQLSALQLLLRGVGSTPEDTRRSVVFASEKAVCGDAGYEELGGVVPATEQI